MSAGKTFRHGQILRLVSDGSIANQEDLRRRLAAQRLRVTQATLSRDIQELRLIKTQRGYKSAAALPEDQSPLRPLARALGEFLLDIRPAENLLVLKTPPSGAQPSRCGSGRIQISGNCRDHRGRRHRADHHAK